MDKYPYALFFKGGSLTVREKTRMMLYFQRQRESGGGDCSPITDVNKEVNKICFKEKEARDRVLARGIHTISLPCGDRHLTMSQTESVPEQEPQTSTRATVTGLVKMYKSNIYLLCFLRDNERVNKIFQKQLSLIGCTVEYNFHEEEMVVEGHAERDAVNLEVQADRMVASLNESYLCYHVCDEAQVRMLEQLAPFGSDDIKVYHETGCSVVVGPVKAVEEAVASLIRSAAALNVPVVETKFKLVEEEFLREMHASHPDVKIHRQDNMLVLEGPNSQVESGAAKLDQFMQKVQDRRVQLSPSLMTFIPYAIPKYQTRFQHSLRKPVFLEVESDLVLFSLSSEALDEAEAALRRELSVVTVKLQGTAAAPPLLDQVKEAVARARATANIRETRVGVRFLPSGSAAVEVQLVGYTENVNRLREVLHQFKTDKDHAMGVLNLPFSELVGCLGEVLGLIGMKSPTVKMQSSSVPTPCVLLSGPGRDVESARQTLAAALLRLTTDKLVLDGPGAQRYFQAKGKMNKELVASSCQVVIAEPKSGSSQRQVSVTVPNRTGLKMRLGSLEDQQVEVLVVPMLNTQLTSTKIGKCILAKGGSAVQTRFISAAANRRLAPGDVLQVDGSPPLACSKLFFIQCLPWDGDGGRSLQALRKGLRSCLDLCAQQGFGSVAFPLIGPGLAMKHSLFEGSDALTQTIGQFASSGLIGTLSTIHVVIKPGYPDSDESYRDVYNSLRMNQALFASLSGDLDDITVTLGTGVKLHLVFGDITHETTDVIVNSTNFTQFFSDGVSNHILTLAGPAVEASVKSATVGRRSIFETPGGSLACKAVYHAWGENDSTVIKNLIHDILRKCDASGYKSVALPALCTGRGGMDAGVVADTMLQAVDAAASSAFLRSLGEVRLVLFQIQVFLKFRDAARRLFPNAALNTAVGNTASVPHTPPPWPTPWPTPVAADLRPRPQQQSSFTIVGQSVENVQKAAAMLKELYESQCSSHSFSREEVESLSPDDAASFDQVAEMEGLLRTRGPRGQVTVSGLKDGVTLAMQLVNEALRQNLRRQVIAKEEEDLYHRVVWCILPVQGQWERLPKTANHQLENKKVAGGVVDAWSQQWNVDLQGMEAARGEQRSQLKRLENRPDFAFPLYWDNMAASEDMKVVALHASSTEYLSVEDAFRNTVPKTVVKIERVQNVHLRRVYEAQKKHIADKNAQACGAQEKLLYHGTTQKNSDSIMRTGFNRRFAGQNATSYGEGTYFAVNASYSAQTKYSKPSITGTQLMFVARVLTGLYTGGKSDMKVPPPVDARKPHNRFDSAVDSVNAPTMYVVFHDNQAYPDYLLTFR